MKRKDDQATVEQQFLDPNSYVTPDGRWVLKGEDWVSQKRMVFRRSEGKCENYFMGLHCENRMDDVHHRLKRSIKRDDRLENLEGLCRKCHNLKHPEKQLRFGSRSAEHS